MPVASSVGKFTAEILTAVYLSFGLVLGAKLPTRFCPDESVFKRHLMVAGGTRGGKSKLYEHLCRQWIEHGRGLAFVDPHSVSADELFSYLAYHFGDLGFAQHNIHYLNPKERLFAFDPFRYAPEANDPLADSEFGYRTWLHNKIRSMTRIIVRAQGESEEEAQKMVRLRRWLFNGLYAVGVRDDNGRHLRLSDIFILLNPRHPHHDRLYRHIAPYLSDSVRSDFEKLRQTKDARKQEDWVESTYNRLREMLSPLVASIFDTDSVPSIDFVSIVRRNGVILASLGSNQYFGTDESHVIAGLIILELRDAAQSTAAESREHFYLYIDEAHHFLGEDLDKMLVESAKYRISLGLAFQDLAKLKKGELDLLPTVISQCGLRVTFQQQFHEHAEILGKSMCGRNYNFEPLFRIADRPDGYDLVVLNSQTFGESTGRSTESGRSTSRGHGNSRELSNSQTRGATFTAGISAQHGHTNSNGASHGTTQTQSESNSEGTSSQHGHSTSSGASRTTGSNETLSNIGLNQQRSQGTNGSAADNWGTNTSDTWGNSSSQTHTDAFGKSTSQSVSESRSLQQGNSRSHSDSLNESRGMSTGESFTTGFSESLSTGANEGWSHSVGSTESLVPRTREEWQLTGRLRESINDQTARFASLIMGLPQQHCLVSMATDQAFVIRVDDVLDPFDLEGFSDEARQAAVEYVKKIIYGHQAYYFTPSDDAMTKSGDPPDNSANAVGDEAAHDPDDPFSHEME